MLKALSNAKREKSTASTCLVCGFSRMQTTLKSLLFNTMHAGAALKPIKQSRHVWSWFTLTFLDKHWLTFARIICSSTSFLFCGSPADFRAAAFSWHWYCRFLIRIIHISHLSIFSTLSCSCFRLKLSNLEKDDSEKKRSNYSLIWYPSRMRVKICCPDWQSYLVTETYSFS